ncbi:hypothetical protein [Clostridium sp.]|uniref:hypothetical protein n=1 Tax=Clostridium sp. TaxID=1506 RepID=UPI003F370B68
MDNICVKCITCNNLYFYDYCKIKRANINNVRLQRECGDYILKKESVKKEVNKLFENGKEEVQKNTNGKCINCKNLFFNNFCKVLRNNISNVKLQRNCGKYEEKIKG